MSLNLVASVWMTIWDEWRWLDECQNIEEEVSSIIPDHVGLTGTDGEWRMDEDNWVDWRDCGEKGRSNGLTFAQKERNPSRFWRVPWAVVSIRRRRLTPRKARLCLSFGSFHEVCLKLDACYIANVTVAAFDNFLERPRYVARMLRNSGSESRIIKIMNDTVIEYPFQNPVQIFAEEIENKWCNAPARKFVHINSILPLE